MIGIIKGFNDQKGRFNRFKFWVHALVMYIIVLVLSVIISVLGGIFGIEFLSQIGSFLGLLGMLYIMFTAYIKRLHDLDKSGWMSLLMLVPLANLYIFIICGFFKGTTGENKYGADPLGGTTQNSNTNSTPNEL